ncbi:MAG: type 1 glutamine amidotransferase domain-containing protein [Thermoplasmata archaeon]
MAKGIVLLENGFEDSELIYPYFRLQEAGYDVDLVSSDDDTYESKHGMKMKPSKTADDVDVSEYDVMVVPGGRAPDRMRIKDSMVDLVKRADKEGLVIASICHGAQLLIEAEVVKGKKMTCWKSVATDLKNAGAEYVDEEVVVDGNFVSSRMPPDLPAFMRETLKVLE